MSKHAKSSNGSFHPLSAPDFLPLPQLRDLQMQRLKAIVQRAYDRVALFRKRHTVQVEELNHLKN